MGPAKSAPPQAVAGFARKQGIKPEDLAIETTPKGEKEAAMANDPVPRYRAWLLANGVDDSELASLEAAIDREIDEAVAFALESPPPDASVLQRDVLAETEAA